MRDLKTLFLLLAILLSLSQVGCKKGKPASNGDGNGEGKASQSETIPGTQFRKDGELAILSSGGIPKARFDIEIASSEQASMQGLMYRESMDESQAMLFDPEGLANTPFWMKNTYIPLDIIFIDDDSRIMNIVENTRPFSEERIYSDGIYRFVLEINAGLSGQFGLTPGDKVEWTKEQ